MFESYPLYERSLASLQLIFAMLGMGLVLSPSDFAGVVRAPRSLVLGLALQLAAVPLIAGALGRALPIPAGVAAGLVLMAAVPGGTLSNVLTYFGRGNIALSITLTGVTTVGALATTPALLRLFLGAHLPPDFEMPTGRIAFEIGVTLLIPLALGMFLGWRLPARRELWSRWSIRLSIGFILVMAIGAGGSGRLDPRTYGPLAPVAVLLTCMAFQLAALAVCRLARLAVADCTALSIEVTLRNANLAVLVKVSLFPAVVGRADPIGDGMFFVALLYGGMALLVSLPPLFLGRRSG